MLNRYKSVKGENVFLLNEEKLGERFFYYVSK